MFEMWKAQKSLTIEQKTQNGKKKIEQRTISRINQRERIKNHSTLRLRCFRFATHFSLSLIHTRIHKIQIHTNKFFREHIFNRFSAHCVRQHSLSSWWHFHRSHVLYIIFFCVGFPLFSCLFIFVFYFQLPRFITLMCRRIHFFIISLVVETVRKREMLSVEKYTSHAEASAPAK